MQLSQQLNLTAFVTLDPAGIVLSTCLGMKNAMIVDTLDLVGKQLWLWGSDPEDMNKRIILAMDNAKTSVSNSVSLNLSFLVSYSFSAWKST